MALPDLLHRNGDWKDYLNDVHQIYLETISRVDLAFDGLPLRTRYFPCDDGKSATFWHMITEGEIESSRTPDERRCERIRWVAWMITNAKTDTSLCWWENTRRGNTHVVIWLRSERFAVILAKRSNYYLLKSAYWVKDHRSDDFDERRRNIGKIGRLNKLGSPEDDPVCSFHSVVDEYIHMMQ